jgi:hypothetical protein
LRAGRFTTAVALLTIMLGLSFANNATAQILTGQVLAGTTPIKHATVTLFGTGYTCVPDPCFSISEPVEKAVSDSDGRFSLDLANARTKDRGMPIPPSTTYTEIENPPRPGSLYLVVNGGDAGKGDNPAIKLVNEFGSAPPDGRLTVNELTTVIAAFALNGIASRSPSGDGLELYRQLIDPATGTLRPVFEQGANSPALVNTLADILHACVISSGPHSKECASLFGSAPAWPTNQPPDNTLFAADNIASSRAHGKSAPFAILPKPQPYMPVLDRSPAGWLLALNFQNLGLKHPTQVFADWSDDTLWILNGGNKSLVELSSKPADLIKPVLAVRKLPVAIRNHPTAFWFYAPQAIYPPNARPKLSGWLSLPSVWLADDKLILLNSDGTPCGASSSGLGLKDAGGIWGCSIFGDGLCIANAGRDEIVEVKRPGHLRCDNSDLGLLGRLKNATPGCGIVGHDVCIANTARDGTILPTPHLGLAEPGHAAACSQNWITNRGNNSVSAFHDFYDWWPPVLRPTVFFHQLTVLPGSPFQGGGLADPQGVACDLKSNVWIANHAPNSNTVTELEVYFDGRNLSELRSLSPESGFSGVGMNRPYGVAVDQLGNIWVSSEGNDSLTVLIGAGQ